MVKSEYAADEEESYNEEEEDQAEWKIVKRQNLQGRNGDVLMLDGEPCRNSGEELLLIQSNANGNESAISSCMSSTTDGSGDSSSSLLSSSRNGNNVGGGMNNASPNCGGTEDRRLRRQIANCNERRRMQSINAGFQALRQLLPRKDGDKMSKAAILQQTADFIQGLKNEKERLLDENEMISHSKKRRLEDEVIRMNTGEFAPTTAGRHRVTEMDILDYIRTIEELRMALAKEKQLRLAYEKDLYDLRSKFVTAETSSAISSANSSPAIGVPTLNFTANPVASNHSLANTAAEFSSTTANSSISQAKVFDPREYLAAAAAAAAVANNESVTTTYKILLNHHQQQQQQPAIVSSVISSAISSLQETLHSQSFDGKESRVAGVGGGGCITTSLPAPIAIHVGGAPPSSKFLMNCLARPDENLSDTSPSSVMHTGSLQDTTKPVTAPDDRSPPNEADSKGDNPNGVGAGGTLSQRNLQSILEAIRHVEGGVMTSAMAC